MKNWATLGALVGLTLGMAGAGPASAQDAAGPIAIEGCAFNPWTLSPFELGGAVGVRFKAAVPADDVDFRLIWGDGKRTNLHDSGRFSPGVTIAHMLDFPLLGPVTGETLHSLHLSVVRAHTNAGAVWEPSEGAPGQDVACAVYPI